MATALLDVGLLFLTLAVAGALALRVGISVIPLYLVGGVLVGPHVLGRLTGVAVPPGEPVATLAELGIVLLLFFLGLEFSIDRLLAARRQVFRAGVVDLAVNFTLGLAVGLALGWTLLEALLLAGIVYVTSSAIVTKALIDLGWIADPESEPVLGVLVFEDLAVAVYLAVVAALLAGVSEGRASIGFGALGGRLALALGFLAVLALAAAYGSGLFARVLDVRSGESFVLRVLGVAVPVAGAALTLGASEAVAAFFVGMGFAGTRHRARIEELLTPVRDVFAAVFFLRVGLQTDPVLLVGVAGVLGLVVLLTTPAKVATGYYAARVYDLPVRRAVRTGTAMVPRGEFSLVIAAAAAAGTGRVMTEVVPALAVGYVLVMSVVGTLLMQRADDLLALLRPEAV